MCCLSPQYLLIFADVFVNESKVFHVSYKVISVRVEGRKDLGSKPLVSFNIQKGICVSK